MIQQFHFWGMYQKEVKSLSQKDMCISKLIAALFTIAKIWKNNLSKCSLTDEWINKMYAKDTHMYVYMYMYIYIYIYIYTHTLK